MDRPDFPALARGGISNTAKAPVRTSALHAAASTAGAGGAASVSGGAATHETPAEKLTADIAELRSMPVTIGTLSGSFSSLVITNSGAPGAVLAGGTLTINL
jgi:hypothetical protein